MSEEYGEAGNLRLPVPFFDLLMTLLICFLIFVAPVRDVDTRSIDIPVAHGGNKGDERPLLAILPHRNDAGWTFEIAVDGRKLSPDALASYAKAQNRKVVIVAPATTSLQDFVAMQSELRSRKIDFGLAVKNSPGAKP